MQRGGERGRSFIAFHAKTIETEVYNGVASDACIQRGISITYTV